MAKTINEIQAEMDAAYKTAYGLDDTQMSNVSEWKTFRGVFAQLAYVIYSFFDGYKKEITDLASSTEYGNESWWRSVILYFQTDTALSIVSGKAIYTNIDIAKQIIKRVAIVEYFNGSILIVQIKVAKETAGLPVPISAPELVQLESYVKARKPSGIQTQVINVAADEVKVIETIYYDGKLDLDDLKDAVLAARNNYLANIVFDSQFNINKYRDTLEKVPGVTDTDISGVSIKPVGGVYTAVARNYEPLSGYYKLVEADCIFSYIAV